MDKNEILARSRLENTFGDEREKQTRTESESFSLIFALAVTLLLVTVNMMKHLPVDNLLAIFWASVAGRNCLLFYHHHRKLNGVVAISAGILCVANIITYLGGI